MRQQTRLSGAPWSEVAWGRRAEAVLADARFCMLFHMLQYAVVNAVNEEIRPQCPVGMGKQFELIPGPTDQSGSAICCAVENKLATGTAECSIQMRWMQVVVRTEFKHGCGLLGHIKCEPIRCIPRRDGLYKDSGRKDAPTYSADAGTGNLGADWAGNTPSVVPCLRWGQVREMDDAVPDLVDIGCDMDFRFHDPFRLGAGEMFDSSESG